MENKFQSILASARIALTVEACDGGVVVGFNLVVHDAAAAVDDDDVGVVVTGGVEAVEEGGAEREGGDDAAGPAAERPAVGARPRPRVAGFGTGGEDEEALPEAVGADADEELPRVEAAEQSVALLALLISAAVAMVEEHVAHGARSLARCYVRLVDARCLWHAGPVQEEKGWKIHWS